MKGNMSFVYKCFASLAVLALLGCGGSKVSTDPQVTSSDDVNTKLGALISLQGDLDDVVESEYVSCSHYGDTANSLIRKICAIAQSADAESKATMLDQLGIFSNSLQTQITQLKDDLVNNILSVSSRIDLVNNTLSTLDSRMTSAENAITALQSAVASLTRNNYKLIKTLADFPAPSGGVITLSASTDYELNGIVNIGTNRLLLSSGTHIFGLSHLNDGLQYSGTSAMISNIANASITISNISIETTAAGNPTIFSLTGNAGTLISITNNYFNDTSLGADLGTITGGKTIWFDGNQSNSSNYMEGITVAGTVLDLEFISNSFYNTDNESVVTMLTITSGTFTTVRIENNHSLSPTSNTLLSAFYITTGATFADAYFIDNTCSNGLLFHSGSVTSETSHWWFQDNTGLSDSTFYGQMNVSTSAAQPTTITNYYPVRGIYASNHTEQFTFQYGVIEDDRTNQSPNLSASVADHGDNYVVGNLLTLASVDGGTQAYVKVGSINATTTGVVTGIGSLVGGTGYVAATGAATSGSDGAGLTVNTTISSFGPITGVGLRAGGTGYHVGDVLTVDGGNGLGTLTVESVSEVVGMVMGISGPTSAGNAYSSGDWVGTSGGFGTGCQVSVSVTTGSIATASINTRGSGYLPSDVLTVAGGDGNGTVTVSDVGESGEVTGLNFATYKPGNNYIAGTSVATTCSTAGKWRCGDDNCKLDVQGVTGRLIYNGATTRNFRVSVNADVTNGSADAKTINFALYKGNTSTEIPTQLATTVTPVWLPATSGAVSPVSFEYIVSIAPNDYLEVWSSTSHASAYTVSYLQTNISPL